ncbi:MAG: SMP-30/gluconolactonase/LRE family protein [Brevundimonas sp.]
MDRQGAGGVRRLSPAMDSIIPPGAGVEVLAEGFDWAEGPVWVEAGGCLLFTDVPQNVIWRWSEADGLSEFMRPSGFDGEDGSHLREPGANGLAIEPSGALLMCDHGNRSLSRVDLITREKTIVVDRFEGRRFNSPNDLVLHRSGAVYFTDPPYGLEGMNESPVKELAHNGVYRRAPDGRVSLIEDALSFPNGVALSPDQRTLYVAVSDPDAPVILAYELDEAGGAQSSRVLFDAAPLMGPDAPGLPDGLKVDARGRIFATGPGGVLVLTPEGELLGVIDTGRATANCAFGPGGASLFMTAGDRLTRVALIPA